jgi:PAS domain-containing protein
MGRDLVIVTFPRADRAFRQHVEAAFARFGDGARPGSIETEIRLAYPDAVVRRQSEIASFAPVSDTWYAYRDGRLAASGGHEAWWLDESLPRTIVTADGRYVDANAGAAELFGVDRARILSGHAGDFTRHEPDPEVERRLFAQLAEDGLLQSTAVVLRPDGQEWPIEFHMRRESGAPDRYVTVMRLRESREVGV